MSIPPHHLEVVRLRVFALADDRPKELLTDQISDPMTAYEAAMELTRTHGRSVADDVWQRFFHRARRLADEPAPSPEESAVWVLINKPLAIMWAVIWRRPDTEDEFTALADMEE